jgi:hypothetical protein
MTLIPAVRKGGLAVSIRAPSANNGASQTVCLSQELAERAFAGYPYVALDINRNRRELTFVPCERAIYGGVATHRLAHEGATAKLASSIHLRASALAGIPHRRYAVARAALGEPVTIHWRSGDE